MADQRDGYICDGGCGCGVCVPAGEAPEPPTHTLWDGTDCGSYAYVGPCEACRRDDEREAARG